MDYKKITLLSLFFFFLVIGCKKKECEETIDKAYVYPVEEAKGKSFDEQIEMFKIPDQILHCLSSEALVKSCLDYPKLPTVWAYETLQQGFDQVSNMCNGFDELWTRADKFQTLYSLYHQKNIDRGNWDSYTDLENGMYLADIINIELIISQNVILHELPVSDKIKLSQLVLDNQKKKVDLINRWDIYGMYTSIAILGRMMYLDNYEPLVQEYNNNRLVFLSVAEILILDYDVVNKIMNLSEDYLEILKSKQK